MLQLPQGLVKQERRLFQPGYRLRLRRAACHGFDLQIQIVHEVIHKIAAPGRPGQIRALRHGGGGHTAFQPAIGIQMAAGTVVDLQ